MAESDKLAEGLSALQADLPDHLKTILRDNLLLVKELFPYLFRNEMQKEGEGQDLVWFLELYREIFAYSVGQCTSGARGEMTKFREVYRKRFRGVIYLTNTSLKEANKVASAEARKSSQDTEADLEVAIEREQMWIEKINNFKKQNVLCAIESESLEGFRAKVRKALPFDPDKEMCFYKQEELLSKFNELMTTAVKEFQDEIPFQEDESELIVFLTSFRSKLDKIMMTLIQTNSANKATAVSFMALLTDDFTKSYKEKISLILESPLMDISSIRNILETERVACLERLDKSEKFGYPEFQQECLKILSWKMLEASKDVLQAAHVTSQAQIDTCEEESKEAVVVCLKKVSNAFEKVSASQYAGSLRRTLEKKVEESMSDLRKDTLANQSVVNSILEMEKKLSTTSLEAGAARARDVKVKLPGEINKIIEVYKKQYVEKMEDLLQRSPNGLEARELDTRNTTILNEINELLEMDIRNKISQHEPVAAHRKSLHTYTDCYWKYVLDANNKNIREREGNEKRERLRLEAQQKLDQQYQVHERKKILDTENSGTSATGSCYSGHTERLSPIVFQFTYSRVVMGMLVDGKPKVVPNEWGEDFTALVIGLTKNETLMYGSAVTARLADAREKEKFAKFWFVGDYIISHDLPWGESIRVEGHDLLITFEFLLGYVLHMLKRSTEIKLGGVSSTAVITVPFSLTSTQRIQIKDAARIAGFLDVHLVNESSAAVCACAKSEYRSTTCRESILVLSLNSGNLDAFVYSYNGVLWKIKMESHAGNYCLQEKTRVPKHEAMSQKPMFKPLLWSTGDGIPKYDGSQTQAIRSVCKQALGQYLDKSKNVNSLPNELLVVCESEQNRKMLETVGKEFARIAQGVNMWEAVLQGAVLLSQNPTRIGESVQDKLAFDVLRASETFASCIVMSKGDNLPHKLKKIATDIPAYHTDVRFYQAKMNTIIPIGDLAIREIGMKQIVGAHLEIDNEGIVKLKYVTVKSDIQSPFPIDDNKYAWKTPNLKDDQWLQDASFLLASNSSNSEGVSLVDLTKQKQALKEKCCEMQHSIAEGSTIFKSELGKSFVLKQIADAIRFVEHPHASKGEVEKQSGIIFKLYSKYFGES